MQAARQRTTPTSQVKPETEEKKGFFASLSSTISNVGTNLSSTVTGATITVQEVDPWFDSHRDYLNNLEQNLTVTKLFFLFHSLFFLFFFSFSCTTPLGKTL
jgi:hypothetical protein